MQCLIDTAILHCNVLMGWRAFEIPQHHTVLSSFFLLRHPKVIDIGFQCFRTKKSVFGHHLLSYLILSYLILSHLILSYLTLPETNIGPGKLMLGRWILLLGWPIFSGLCWFQVAYRYVRWRSWTWSAMTSAADPCEIFLGGAREVLSSAFCGSCNNRTYVIVLLVIPASPLKRHFWTAWFFGRWFHANYSNLRVTRQFPTLLRNKASFNFDSHNDSGKICLNCWFIFNFGRCRWYPPWN